MAYTRLIGLSMQLFITDQMLCAESAHAHHESGAEMHSAQSSSEYVDSQASYLKGMKPNFNFALYATLNMDR